MNAWQQLILLFYTLLALYAFSKSLFEIIKKQNHFGLTAPLIVLGIFVWGDAFVLGVFWLIVCGVVWFLQDWYLFLLTLSLFWVVRSLGEIIYWIAEQFAHSHRNAPHTLRFYGVFKNDAVWFIYQLIWQCVLVIALIASLYFAKLWLR